MRVVKMSAPKRRRIAEDDEFQRLIDQMIEIRATRARPTQEKESSERALAVDNIRRLVLLHVPAGDIDAMRSFTQLNMDMSTFYDTLTKGTQKDLAFLRELETRHLRQRTGHGMGDDWIVSVQGTPPYAWAQRFVPGARAVGQVSRLSKATLTPLWRRHEEAKLQRFQEFQRSATHIPTEQTPFTLPADIALAKRLDEYGFDDE